MSSQKIREFYAFHSVTSDPGTLASMLDGLPTDIEELRDVIGGFLIHIGTASDLLSEPEPADRGNGELTVHTMLQKVLAVDPAPLDVPRPAKKRLRVNCRGFAMMFVSVLRHQGVPARKRVGFDWAGWIHEIGEYWDDHCDRWVFVDVDPATREPIRRFLTSITPEEHDAQTEVIKAGEAFHPGGLAWRQCRSGERSPEDFRVAPAAPMVVRPSRIPGRSSTQVIDYDGMDGVRTALIQDLDSLNKVELRSFDGWHELINAPWDKLNEASLAWHDQAAALTENSDARFREMREFYVNSSYGSSVQTQLAQVVG